jgi:hypothetical protein
MRLGLREELANGLEGGVSLELSMLLLWLCEEVCNDDGIVGLLVKLVGVLVVDCLLKVELSKEV